MKKTTFPLLLVLVTLFAGISSCKKSDPGSGTSKVSFTASGTTYNYTSSSGMLSTASINLTALSAVDPANSSNQLVLRVSNTAGTSAFYGATTLEWLINSKVYTSNSTVNEGSIQLSPAGSTATASFTNVTLYNAANTSDSIVVTGGSYSGKYYSN